MARIFVHFPAFIRDGKDTLDHYVENNFGPGKNEELAVTRALHDIAREVQTDFDVLGTLEVEMYDGAFQRMDPGCIGCDNNTQDKWSLRYFPAKLLPLSAMNGGPFNAGAGEIKHGLVREDPRIAGRQKWTRWVRGVNAALNGGVFLPSEYLIRVWAPSNKNDAGNYSFTTDLHSESLKDRFETMLGNLKSQGYSITEAVPEPVVSYGDIRDEGY